MDQVKSFKGYGKVDELQENAFRRKTRRRCIILAVSSVVLLAVIIGAVVGIVVHKNNSDSESDTIPASPMTPKSSLKAVCTVTEYPDSCFTSISSLKSSSNTTDPEDFFKLSLQVAINELSKLSEYPPKIIATSNDTVTKEALLVCVTLFDDAIGRLNDSISSMADGEKILSTAKINDIRTWLSSTITDQETCLDGLRDFNSTLVSDVEQFMKNSTEFASNSLAIVSKILGILSDFNIPVHRKLLGDFEHSNNFPYWVGSGDRKLLQTTNPVPNVIVAKDGSGKYKTIKEAVAAVPKKSLTRFIIYVKAGVYDENVNVDKNTWNVMIYGDGKNKTIVTGKLNVVDGTPTFSSATFATVGKNFIARDMRFVNSAGAIKHQAVALRSGADFSVFYRCAFEAFQDTLYTHSNRQFYRDCDIIGTVDFIFGNAAVVFQNCTIMPRQPLSGQFCTITAQGKKDPNQNTGTSIQKCNLIPYDNLTAMTYLGRPWQIYSTTVIMQSTIGSFLNPQGWIEWVKGVTPPKTIYYAEYLNTGPGSGVAQRVNWPGYKSTITATEAGKFTVANFIQGKEWLPATTVAFDSAL